MESTEATTSNVSILRSCKQERDQKLPTLVAETAGKPSLRHAASSSKLELLFTPGWGTTPGLCRLCSLNTVDSTLNLLKIGSQIPSWFPLPDRILGHIAPGKVCPTLEVKS